MSPRSSSGIAICLRWRFLWPRRSRRIVCAGSRNETPESTVLRGLQEQFMHGLFENQAVPGISPPAALATYANNARVNFTETLKRTYPAVSRLVGEDYFRQCAREYRRRYPSRSGDLQHVGVRFS